MTHSVLIAAYNAAAFIPKALESLRVQTDTDWELIVVEDGSHDDTEQLVRHFAALISQPVHYTNAGVNRGVSATRTRLLSLARGELCSFLDADDWWGPRHLATVAAAAVSADLVVSDISLHDIDNNLSLGGYVAPETLATAPAATLFRTSAIMTSSCVTLRRELAVSAGTFDTTLRIGEDRDYWLRCALAGGRFALTHATTCTYSKHATSTMTRTQLWAECETAFYEKYKDLDAIPLVERRALLSHALENQARLLRKTDPATSTRLLRRAWKLSPGNLPLCARWAYSALLAAAR